MAYPRVTNPNLFEEEDDDFGRSPQRVAPRLNNPFQSLSRNPVAIAAVSTGKVILCTLGLFTGLNILLPAQGEAVVLKILQYVMFGSVIYLNLSIRAKSPKARLLQLILSVLLISFLYNAVPHAQDWTNADHSH